MKTAAATIPTPPGRWAGTFARMIAGATSGLLLARAFPPDPRPALLLLGLVLTGLALHRASIGERVGAGLMVGVGWYHGLLAALAPEWGLDRAAVMFLASVASLGVVFLAAALLATRLPRWAEPWSLAIVWPAITWVLERVASTPHMFATAWVDHPALLGALRVLGVPLWDGALLAAVGGALVLALEPAGRRSATVVIGAALGLLGVGALAPMPESDGVVDVAGLQPMIASREYEAARWSLFTRHQVEARLDEGTQAALRDGARVVVWPEGGNELPNRGLARRRERLASIGGHEGATILVGSRELDEDGGVSNTLSAWRDGAFHEEIRKAHPVPVAESALRAGPPGVIMAEGARMGIAICFDVLFGAHASALRELGAEVVVVSSDDASFGDAPLSAWHLAVARVRALELGRPLVFVSNAGPSGIYDAAGAALSTLPLGARGLVRAEVPKVPRGGAPWPALGAALSVMMSVVITIRSLRGRVVLGSRTESIAGPRWVYGVGALGVAALIVAQADRATAHAPVDALSPLFQQTAQESCGPAALAFALTYLGDEVTEAALSDGRTNDTSLAELSERATRRGFVAKGVRASVSDLEGLGAAVAIAHYDVGHFVVVLSIEGDQVWLFDPAFGRTLQVPRRAFESVYSGRALLLTPRAT